MDFLTLKMKIRKLTKKMIFHKAKYFSAKRGSATATRSMKYHDKMYLVYKNRFHIAVQVRICNFKESQKQRKRRPKF